jgi:hypothetical protein
MSFAEMETEQERMRENGQMIETAANSIVSFIANLPDNIFDGHDRFKQKVDSLSTDLIRNTHELLTGQKASAQKLLAEARRLQAEKKLVNEERARLRRSARLAGLNSSSLNRSRSRERGGSKKRRTSRK